MSQGGLFMIECKKCKKPKSDGDFYASSKSTCKDCVRARSLEYRDLNIEQVREYDRCRGNRQDKGYLKDYRNKNPKRYKAHNIVNNSIRDKKLFKDPCEICGNEKSVAHHDDYDKPLNIRWLCQAHHKQWHAEHGEGLNAQ
jgi:hypothetical protein